MLTQRGRECPRLRELPPVPIDLMEMLGEVVLVTDSAGFIGSARVGVPVPGTANQAWWHPLGAAAAQWLELQDR